MADIQEPSLFVTLMAPVLYDPDLSPNAKLLYGVISSLTPLRGYCYAENSTLAEWFGVTERQVSRLVKELVERGHIYTRMGATKKGSQRRIFLANVLIPEGADKNVYTPGGVDKNVQGGVDENVHPHIRNDNSNTDNTPHNPPKGGRGRKAKPEPDWLRDRFEGFWKFYPRDYRGNKQRARTAWNRLKPDEATMRAMANAIKRHLTSGRWKDGVGVPNASTFINPANGYWEPEDATAPAKPQSQDSGPAVVVESRYPKL